MELGPIWRALLRNKTSYILIALQIAVTMAIMVNAIGIIQERSIAMERPSGADEENIFYLSSIIFDESVDNHAQTDEDLDALRNFPGVRDAIATNSVPLRGGGWSMGLQHEPGMDVEGTGVAIYFVDEHGVESFGVDIVAGRNFLPNEVVWNDPESNAWPPVAILTVAMVEQMYPDENPSDAVGRTLYIDTDQPVTIIGIMDRLQAPWNGWRGVEQSMLVPQKRGSAFTRYVIRAEDGYRDELMPQIEEMLAASSNDRIIRSLTTMEETRQRSYRSDASMVKLLIFVVAVLTAVTGLGIVGLASFSVARRTKQIGTRRALGATRPSILRHFMLENFLISTTGVIAGAILAVALNMWMVEAFGLTPIAWYLVPAAMIVLWVVGQIAVFGPARRASRVSPAIATRTA